VREHRGRGGLAVRAGDADRVAVGLHDVAPGLRALEDGDALGPGGGDLGVVVVDGGGADDAVGAADVLGAVADKDGDTVIDELARRNGGVHVGAGDLHAHAAQHEAERTHGDAADADEVGAPAGLEVIRNIVGGGCCGHTRILQRKPISCCAETGNFL